MRFFTGKRCLAIAAALALALTVSVPALVRADDAKVVSIYTVGDEPAGWKQVQEAINARTQSELGLTIDVTFAGWDNYGNKLQMELAAGEPYSWVYDANWCALSADLAAGYYTNLDDLIPQYAPDMLAKKGQDVLDANKVAGPDGVYHCYTLPNGSGFGTASQAWVRKDLREAMGYPEITTYDQLIDFLYKVKAAYPDIVPVTPYCNSAYLNQAIFAVNSQLDKTPGYMNSTALSDDGVVYMKGNDGKYYNIFDDMPEALDAAIRQARQMYQDGIIDPDVMTDTTDKLTQGTAAVLYKQDIGVNGDQLDSLKKIAPDAQLEAVSFYDYSKNGQVVTDYKAKDFLCMPVTCPDPEAALKFLNWLSLSQDNYDLLESGIQGVTWTPVGDHQYTYVSDLWERFSWRIFRLPQYERLDTNFTADEIDHILNYWRNPDWYTKSVTTGFGYDPSGVQNEISVYNTAVQQYWYPILDGAVDPDEGLAAFKTAAYDAVTAIQKDMQTQLDAYLGK